jgi:hypothetical protein
MAMEVVPQQPLKNPFRGSTKAEKARSIYEELQEMVNAISPERFKAEAVRKGGEHLVLMLEGHRHRNIVYKVNFEQTNESFLAALRSVRGRRKGLSDDQVWEETFLLFPSILRRRLEERRHMFDELAEYIGRELVSPNEEASGERAESAERKKREKSAGKKALLRQVLTAADVPINEEILSAVLFQNLPKTLELPEKITAWVMIQEKVKETDERLSLTGFYPEDPRELMKYDDEYTRELYEKATKLFVGGEMEEMPEEQKFLATRVYPSLAEIQQTIRKEPDLKEKLMPVLRGMMAYMRETGVVLDLTGSDNVIAFKKNGAWEVKLADPFPPNNSSVRDLQEVSKQFKRGGLVTPASGSSALYVLNNVRFTNALAAILDMPDRLYVPEAAHVSPSKWLDLRYRKSG